MLRNVSLISSNRLQSGLLTGYVIGPLPIQRPRQLLFGYILCCYQVEMGLLSLIMFLGLQLLEKVFPNIRLNELFYLF